MNSNLVLKSIAEGVKEFYSDLICNATTIFCLISRDLRAIHLIEDRVKTITDRIF